VVHKLFNMLLVTLVESKTKRICDIPHSIIRSSNIIQHHYATWHYYRYYIDYNYQWQRSSSDKQLYCFLWFCSISTYLLIHPWKDAMQSVLTQHSATARTRCRQIHVSDRDQGEAPHSSRVLNTVLQRYYLQHQYYLQYKVKLIYSAPFCVTSEPVLSQNNKSRWCY